jgi:hypothetical protein
LPVSETNPKKASNDRTRAEVYEGDTTDTEDTHTQFVANIAKKIVRAPKRASTSKKGTSTKKVEGSKKYVQTKYNFGRIRKK